ncbi:MAG: MutS-related protein [Chloroflexota bacterium]
MAGLEREPPACFEDLHLDQVLDGMLAGRQEYDLAPYFYSPLHDVESVGYRHEALRDLAQPEVLAAVEAFGARARRAREYLGQVEKLHYKYEKERTFLDAADLYCESVRALFSDLNGLTLHSCAFRAFREYLGHYTASADFTSLKSETETVRASLESVKYSTLIKGNRVTVSYQQGDADYSAQVGETFAKFRQGAVKDHQVKLPNWPGMNHVEARIVDLVAKLYPDVFRSLDEFVGRHRDFLDPTIGRFDREVQFYLAHLEFAQRFEGAGLRFCYPEVSASSKEVRAINAFDLALANKLVPEGSPVVTNDFCLQGRDRVVVITGPNQGGKTTFARMFGQLHYLASLGMTVPAERTALFLPDRIFTHFEKEERLASLRGKLEDELMRIRDVLQEATGSSIVIMNESFSATTLSDSLFLGKEIMTRLTALDVLGVYVTFVDELASFGDSTVSLVSAISLDNPAVRTFKIERRAADGLAYAAAIADKYGLTYEALRKRMAE